MLFDFSDLVIWPFLCCYLEMNFLIDPPILTAIHYFVDSSFCPASSACCQAHPWCPPNCHSLQFVFIVCFLEWMPANSSLFSRILAIPNYHYLNRSHLLLLAAVLFLFFVTYWFTGLILQWHQIHYHPFSCLKVKEFE